MKTTDSLDLFKFYSQEERALAMQCAGKIRNHLSRLVHKESKVKYFNNLVALDELTEQFQSKNVRVFVAV